jgi:hypothetical protein
VHRVAVTHATNPSSRSTSASGFGIHTARPASNIATPSSPLLVFPGLTASTMTASARFGFARRRNTVRFLKSTGMTSGT